MKFSKKTCVQVFAAITFILLISTLYLSRFMWDEKNWKSYAVSNNLNLMSNMTIPKIIHRTWKNNDIPKKWKSSFDHCKAMYPDYKHILWTDEESRKFIELEYPTFLQNFDSYWYPIQKADAIRYFVLYHFGGIYMDLDIGCSTKDISDLLRYDALIPKTEPIGFSNDMMACTKNHPFFKQLIESLGSWNHWYLTPYLTIFFSTGPMFLNIQFGLYNTKINLPVYILDPEFYSRESTSYFRHLIGNSWHSWDA
ncbi:hypothetical protein HDV02_006230, partial [Globomyces sp. JEL0801]